MTKKFKKILVANRGEIAIRVMKTCKEMGIATVSLYTDEEISLPHTHFADEKIALGSGALSETYLNIAKIVGAAKELGVDAIHPGYGFLSENSQFAKAVTEAGITFIGPTTESIELMGDKKKSKQKMEEINIPLVPGYHGDNQEADFLLSKAKEIGFPVLVKASAGGGGKGMRIVENAESFTEGLDSAKREALNAFGDDTVLIEKFITNPRHIEVQVMSDTHGGHFHFYERECSIQRRHQKIVEETPSTSLDDKSRASICQTAVDICRGINYEGAGTVEYILDDDGSYYFLEMNTRLQVEHPVTEMVCGVDLVAMQIKVAQGEKLDIDQGQVKQNGHAIEVRIYSEDPDNNFMPAIGKIHHVGAPELNQVRLDCGYSNGNEVTVNFDPMLAKLIAWGENREIATTKIIDSLNETPFLGIKTNRNYLQRVLSLEEFAKGETYTHFVKTYEEKLLPKEVSDEEVALVVAAELFQNTRGDSQTISNVNVWGRPTSFRNV